MKAKTKPVADAFDAAELADTVRSPGHARIVNRLHETRRIWVEALIEAKTWDDARKMQGAIHGIDLALSIPEIMRHEDAKRMKNDEPS